MMNDGKSLEALVSFVERLHLPPGVDVKTNTRIFNEEGIQISEFDVEIRGRWGTTEIAWLIQCRDRPTKSAPGEWIEQLVGRRDRFGFNKITAVSTSGFSPGAVSYAKETGIELREVRDLSPEEFSRWFVANTIPLRHPQGKLLGVNVIFSNEEMALVSEFLKGKSVTEKLFRSTETGEMVSALEVFQSQLNTPNMDAIMQKMKPEDGEKNAKLTFQFPSDTSHYVVDFASRAARIREFIFTCKLLVSEMLLPITKSAEYTLVDGAKPISQMVAYEFPAWDRQLSLEMHNISETGETHVILRVLGELNKK